MSTSTLSIVNQHQIQVLLHSFGTSSQIWLLIIMIQRKKFKRLSCFLENNHLKICIYPSLDIYSINMQVLERHKNNENLNFGISQYYFCKQTMQAPHNIGAKVAKHGVMLTKQNKIQNPLLGRKNSFLSKMDHSVVFTVRK